MRWVSVVSWGTFMQPLVFRMTVRFADLAELIGIV